MRIKIMIIACALVITTFSACGRTNREKQTDAENTQNTQSEGSNDMTWNNDSLYDIKGGYTAKSRISDVINDPVFEDYGRLIFPTDFKIDDDLKLSEVSSILPWYSEVNTDKTVEIVNSPATVTRRIAVSDLPSNTGIIAADIVSRAGAVLLPLGVDIGLLSSSINKGP